MNCQDVVAFVIEPGTPPERVREHLRSCESCRAQMSESRRVASLMADLPVAPGSDIASRVMRQIGYGNGRPTRDKILDQLDKVREELDAVICEADGLVDVGPAPGEPSVAEIAAHLPSLENARTVSAEPSLAGRAIHDAAGKPAKPSSASSQASADGAGHKHTTGGNGSASMDDLRRVRERTLRLVSGLDPRQLDHTSAEILRTIYRHEADHVAQMSDTLWRLRRKAELRSPEPGDCH